MRRIALVLAVLAAFVVVSAADAAVQFTASGRNPNPVTVQPWRAPGDPVNLVLDDGSRDNDIGIGGYQMVWLNRFTPTEFPIRINLVQVYFSTAGGAQVGQTFDVFLYANTAGSADPAVGAAYVGGQTGNAITVVDGWTDVALTMPLDFAGPGDVLVAVVNRTVAVAPSTWPAAMDQTTTQARSWAGWYGTTTITPPPTPPTLPPDNWTLIDAYFPGNWMVRATGAVTPAELITLTLE
jgi:hypothetical protein